MKNLQLEPNIRNILAEPKRHRLEVRVHHGHDVLLLPLVIIIMFIVRFMFIVMFMFTIIIIITRPKPNYSRQGLAVSWGQNTDEVSTFLVFLTSHFAPAVISSDLTNLGPLMTMKIHLETLKNHGNQPKTMKPP